MIDHIYIIGHRGTGKTTTARLVAERLGLEAVDVDEVLEAGEQKSCAEIIAESEPRFRELEREYLAKIVAEPSDKARVISLGGGFSPVPDDGVCVWLYRDGWEDAARGERARLREGAFADEVAWMIEAREPRWEEAAHLRVDVPRGRGPERVADDVATMIGWLLELGESSIARRSWVVPAGPEQFGRAVRDADLFGFAGVEVRSDLLGADAADKLSVDVLASLRTAEPGWLGRFEHAAAFDVDISLLDDVLEAGVLAEMEPRALLVSWHPSEPAAERVDELVSGARRVVEAHPGWADGLVLKYAPTLGDYADLVEAIDAAERLREAGFGVTFLPQGARFSWCRPPLALENASNYVPVGLGPQRRRHTDNPVKTPLDLQGWLVHFGLETRPGRSGTEGETRPGRSGTEGETRPGRSGSEAGFEALIGEPVAASQGDLWHRRAAEAEGRNASYLKIPFGREGSTEQLKLLLDCAAWLGVRGLSVTSPLKRAILAPESVDNPEGLSAANTLRRVDGGWEATDTDEAGMRATLEAAEDAGISPGTVAIIGRGGVSPAVLRAVEESEWDLVHHASGREGWTDDAPGEVTMVVNAAGDSDTAYGAPPVCEVWVDLHYMGVRRPPVGVKVHFNGDTFFDAQARAQRHYWYGAD